MTALTGRGAPAGDAGLKDCTDRYTNGLARFVTAFAIHPLALPMGELAAISRLRG